MTINLANAGLPRMAWYDDLKSATSNLIYFVQLLFFIPKVTGRTTKPSGVAAFPVMML
jgi:hypothetical protein